MEKFPERYASRSGNLISSCRALLIVRAARSAGCRASCCLELEVAGWSAEEFEGRAGVVVFEFIDGRPSWDELKAGAGIEGLTAGV